MLTGFGWCHLRSLKPAATAALEQDQVVAAADEALWRSFRDWMAETTSPFLDWRLVDHLNNASGLLTFTVSRNHRSSHVWTMLDWIVENGPASYGLFYVHDDEDSKGNHSYDRGNADRSNVFRVHRLMNGQIVELPDPFFGQIVPALEDP